MKRGLLGLSSLLILSGTSLTTVAYTNLASITFNNSTSANNFIDCGYTGIARDPFMHSPRFESNKYYDEPPLYADDPSWTWQIVNYDSTWRDDYGRTVPYHQSQYYLNYVTKYNAIVRAPDPDTDPDWLNIRAVIAPDGSFSQHFRLYNYGWPGHKYVKMECTLVDMNNSIAEGQSTFGVKIDDDMTVSWFSDNPLIHMTRLTTGLAGAEPTNFTYDITYG